MEIKTKFRLDVEAQETCSEHSYSPVQSFVEGTPLNENNIELDQQYKRLQTEFRNEENNPKRKSFILEISHKISVLYNWNLNTSDRIIMEVAGFFHMNIIEIAYWKTLLKSSKGSAIVPELVLLITALQSKFELNPDSRCYEYWISVRILNFCRLFENWRLVNECLGPSLRNLNKEFENLGKQKRGQVDYEDEVSFILNSTHKRKKIEVEPEVQEAKLSSNHFEVDELDFPPIDNL